MLESKNTIIVFGDCAEILLKDKDGKEVGRAKINIDDVDRCKDIKWYLCISSGGNSTVSNPNVGSLAKYILNYGENEFVEYIDGNLLNCKRNNLKVNRYTSKYKGVCWDKHCKRWKASIRITKGENPKHLGSFNSEEEGAIAYDKASLRYKGLSSELNFPIESYEDYINELGLNKKTIYKGVYWYEKYGKWQSQVYILGKGKKYLGRYDTAKEAAIAYDRAALQYRGLDSELNFPIENYTEYINNELKLNKNNNDLNNEGDNEVMETMVLNIYDANNKQIDYALIDGKHYDKIKAYKWFKDDDNNYYTTIDDSIMYLPYMILEVGDGEYLEYSSNDFRDNRESNLNIVVDENAKEVFNNGYNKGYNEGFDNGYNKGKEEGAENLLNDMFKKYTLAELLEKYNSVINSPTKSDSNNKPYTVLKDCPNEIFVYEDYIEILIPYKEEVVKVKTNKRYLDMIKKYRWRFNTNGGAYTNEYIKNKSVMLKRLITALVNDKNYGTKPKDNDLTNCLKENIAIFPNGKIQR